MSRILFDYARPVVESDPARNDVACFVGLARAMGTALPAAMQDWLETHGWTDGPAARSIAPPFTDLPLPIESYAAFTALFDPGGSPDSYGTDYLATAVRSFFAQGGRRCYVIRMGNPLTPQDDVSQAGSTTDDGISQSESTGKPGKLAKLLRGLLPGDYYGLDNRRTWHGVGHLGGLPDVSFLALPDLPMLCASAPSAAAGIEVVPPSGSARFVECSQVSPAAPATPLYLLPAPRLTADDYYARTALPYTWGFCVQAVLSFLQENNIRDIQFVAALPMPLEVDAASAAESSSNAALDQDIHDVIDNLMPENISPGATDAPDNPGMSTAFLQLAYPWLKTSGSGVLNESLEPPDGALVGILARNALTRGAFMDAVKIVPAEIFDLSPALPAQEAAIPVTLTWGDNSWKPLIVRISLFGFTPGGLRLLSDVTTYPGEAYRQACVHRLVSVISRAAQQLGERMVFQQNGPLLWERIETSLTTLMTQLWQANALDGATAPDAFTVRCDASTMTQNDLDNGRLIAEVTFTAAATIELIRVTLAIETSGASAQGIAAMAGAS